MPSAAQLNHRLNEAIAHHNAGRLERAAALYRQLVAAAPNHAGLHCLIGQLAEQQGRYPDALASYRHSIELDPAGVVATTRCANLLMATARIPAAEALLRRLVTLAPKSPLAWNSLAFATKLAGRARDALEFHQKAVTLDPKYAEGWCHFGLTLGVVGRNHDALKCFDFALALQPEYAAARFGRAQSLHKIYRIDEAITEYDAVLRAEPANHDARSYRLYALQGSDRTTTEQLWAEHRAYGVAVQSVDAAPLPAEGGPNKRLRVAVLSPDLRTHSCAYFLAPLLQHLDRDQFELYLYHDHFVEDSVSERFRRMAAQWRNFVGQPNHLVAETIQADRPDILIDLTGHVCGTVRLPIFARRLAPVQISYLGYPDTTGLTAMDYRFTDAIADPAPSADAFASEQLVRFAPTAWAYEPPSEAPAIAPVQDRADAPITFGCFNSPTKFNPTLYRAWAALLQRVPHSRLLLKGRDFDAAPVREHLLHEMATAGIPVDRLTLLPRTITTGAHLAQYADVDVALDTFPYNGTTTTCEALWMGRPVVTIEGERHASRVGASLLRAVGREAWIAHDSEGYVNIAAALALDVAGRIAAAGDLRAEMRLSPLLDHAGQSSRFAVALRECWRARVTASAAAA